MLCLPGVKDPVMEDGTTAFSMALAKGQCNLIDELLRRERARDIELAHYALLETNINEEVRKMLKESIGVSHITYTGSHFQHSWE